MKSMFLFLLFMLLSHNLTYAQGNMFFSDVAKMKLSLCFKDYIMVDNNIMPTELSAGVTSHQVFLRSDSSLIVLLVLSSLTNQVYTSKSPKMIYSSEKENKNLRSKKNKLLVKKFHAQSGFATSIPEHPSQHFNGYVEVRSEEHTSELQS